MIKVFYSSDGFRGITQRLLEEALTRYSGKGLPDYSGTLYLAPNQAKVNEARRIFHKIITEDPFLKPCYIPPRMMTVAELARRTCSEHSNARVLAGSLIPAIIFALSEKGIGFSSLIAEFFRDIKGNYPDKDAGEVREIFLSAFRECNIPEAVSSLPVSCLDIFERYQTLIRERGLIDEDDAMKDCAAYLSSVRHDAVVIDGFYDPPRIERNILRELIRNSGQSLISIPLMPDSAGETESYLNFLRQEFEMQEALVSPECSIESVRSYVSYPDPEAEVEGIARNIKSLYVSGRHRDLEAVIAAFPDLKKYGPMVERVFRRYGIPYNALFKKPLSGTRFFLDVSCLLASVSNGYPRLKFSQFLASPYFGRIPESLRKWVPVCLPQSGIISGLESWLDFVSGGSEAVDIKEIQAAEGINLTEDMEWVFSKIRPLEEIRTSATFARYTDVLKKVLDDFGFSGSRFTEYESVTLLNDEKKALEDLMDYMYFLNALCPMPVTFLRFIEIFEHLAGSLFIGEEGPGVRIMDFFSVTGLSPEYLYLGGLTDGAMPLRQEMDYLMPDSVRKKMGFLHLDKYIALQRFMFDCAVKSSENIHLSYPLMEAEDMFLPSAFLYSGKESVESLPGIFSKEELLVGSGGEPLLSHINEIEDRSVSVFSDFLKVTDIDAYRQCPRKFFIEKVLRLEPLSIKEYEVEAVTIGNILHRIMERLVFEPLESLDHLKARAVRIIDDILNGRRLDTYWKELIKDTFIRILPDIRSREILTRGEGYMPFEAEKNITGEPVKGIRLKGKIDRIDRAGDAVRIIDYKTGAAALNCVQAVKGRENLQLFLYAALMRDLGYAIDRVGIYSLKDINIKWCPPKSRGRGQEAKARDGIDGYMTASLKFLEDAVRDLKKGDFRAEPLDDYNCRRCHENPFCPYIQQ